MAKNTGNKRAPVKHLRDGIKSQYPKGDKCEITGSTEDLEYHHYSTLSLIFDKFCKEHKLIIKTDEDVLAIREQFYSEYWNEVVTDGVTLTAEWHKELHKVYGSQPSLSTVEKQKNWVIRMKDKLTGMPTGTDSTSSSRFERFLDGNTDRFSGLIL